MLEIIFKMLLDLIENSVRFKRENICIEAGSNASPERIKKMYFKLKKNYFPNLFFLNIYIRWPILR